MHWGRLSDSIGRKPVIITGLLGLTLSMFSFGISKSFVGLVVSRALAGALNANTGVLKTIIAEITDETNVAGAYSCLPIVWFVGVTFA
jgi:MFS family permease